jgi:cyclopropane-fatty-acyl-phospholipid synthase
MQLSDLAVVRRGMRALSRRLVLNSLEEISDGHLELHCPGGKRYAFGDPASDVRAVAEIKDEQTFSRTVFGGDIGLGEAYVEGLWTTPDLVSLVRLAVRNMRVFDAGARVPAILTRSFERLRHSLRRNTPSGSRENIRYHYDLGTDFYALFLDPTLTYSCAYFETPDASLQEAQLAKCDRICRKLELSPGDRLLEIGSGWGSFSIHAAREYGARVTTTTISRAQYEHVRKLLEREGLTGRVELLCKDYRTLAGRFDKAVSIEMFEAVGLSYYDDFFSVINRLLEPGGTMLLQTITMDDQRFPRYRRRPDFLRRYIFPGGELASVLEIRKSLARATRLSIAALEEIGPHYTRTLAAWRRAFLANLPRVRALGFPETFIRMWDYYLASSQGGFAESYIGDAQILLAREPVPGIRDALPAETLSLQRQA